MAFKLLIINGHDYSAYVESDGYDWDREDLDSEKSTRVKTGRMRRDKITEKQNPEFTMRPMPHALVGQLDNDLRLQTFEATIFTPHGLHPSEFYCSSFKARIDQVTDENSIIWSDISFTMHEV